MRRLKHPERVIAIGDLNGAAGVLRSILRRARLVDTRDRWCARAGTHLIQLGDVFNRGSSAREAFEWLGDLSEQAARAGSKVTRLLGNHEAMMAMHAENYCTEEEYLSFATAAERRRWPAEVRAARKRLEQIRRELAECHPTDTSAAVQYDVDAELAAWRLQNAPGRWAMRQELGPSGRIGQAIRTLPVAVQAAGCTFVHAPIAAEWAQCGLESLNREARSAWDGEPDEDGGEHDYIDYEDWLPDRSILRSRDGPLWQRYILASQDPVAWEILHTSLRLLRSKRMVIGHVPTRGLPGGRNGRVLLLHRKRLVCIDVGIAEHRPRQWAALEIIDGRGFELGPGGRRRLLWTDRPA